MSAIATTQGATVAAVRAAAGADQFQALYEHPSFHLERDASRDAALIQLRETGFPLRENESWAHTPVRELLRPQYRLPASDAVRYEPGWLAWQGQRSAAEGVSLLVAVDGRAVGDSSLETGGTTEAGIRLPVAEAAADAFHQLGVVFGDTPRHIFVKGGTPEVPLRYQLAHVISDGVVAAPRTRITLSPGASATIVESFESAGGRTGPGREPSLCLPRTEVEVGEGAHLELLRVQAEGPNAFHVSSAIVVQAAGSHVHVLSVDVGATLARGSLAARLGGSHASCQLSGVSVAGDTQTMDAQTVLEHAAPESQSRQLFKRVLTAEANAVFAGRIVVREAAQQTDAFQLNSNLLLGTGSAVSKPQLEIAADDVRCSHGATVGQLDDDQLFYLRSRGIPPATANVMLANGFCAEPIASLADPELRAVVGALVAGELGERLARAGQGLDR